MAMLFKPNLERGGRVWRGVMAAVLLISGTVVSFWQVWAGMILIASGAFVLFEALRGWCVLRACGIKTRM